MLKSTEPNLYTIAIFNQAKIQGFVKITKNIELNKLIVIVKLKNLEPNTFYTIRVLKYDWLRQYCKTFCCDSYMNMSKIEFDLGNFTSDFHGQMNYSFFDNINETQYFRVLSFLKKRIVIVELADDFQISMSKQLIGQADIQQINE